MRPIRIRAGAIGIGIPNMDLVVSPQHRVLVDSEIAKRLFGQKEVLVAAKFLLDIEGFDIVDDFTEVEYFHFIFDGHMVVYSNGVATASLYLGPQALKSLEPEALQEVFEIFLELNTPGMNLLQKPARTLLSGKQGRKLSFLHAKGSRALVTSKARGSCQGRVSNVSDLIRGTVFTVLRSFMRMAMRKRCARSVANK